MSNFKNPPPDALRKHLTKEEKQWLQAFNQYWEKNDKKNLGKIVASPDIVTDLIVAGDKRSNEKRGCIMNKFRKVSVNIENQSREGIEDPSANPAYPKRERNRRYTPEDYTTTYKPNEAAVIEIMDYMRVKKGA